MANKLRQDPSIKGIKILGNELKLSQYADDTNLLCADLASVANFLEVVENFGNLAGLKLNRKKTKAIWLGIFCIFCIFGIFGIFVPAGSFKGSWLGYYYLLFSGPSWGLC